MKLYLNKKLKEEKIKTCPNNHVNIVNNKNNNYDDINYCSKCGKKLIESKSHKKIFKPKIIIEYTMPNTVADNKKEVKEGLGEMVENNNDLEFFSNKVRYKFVAQELK